MPFLDLIPIWLTFPLGFVLMIFGAQWLVDSGSAIARGLGMSPLVVGLTVVAFGTSAPELAVSVGAAFTGNADLALGNVLGSNITNVLLILGASAIIAPLIVRKQLLKLDLPVMIGSSLAAWAMALDGKIGRIDGIILVIALATYIFWLLRIVRRDKRAAAAIQEEVAESEGPLWKSFVWLGVGMLAMLLGTRWLVSGATSIAVALNVSNLVIGLTIVALGSSLPEVMTSIVASVKGQRDIAVGNVVGSNIFNIFSVLGITAAIAPDGLAVPQNSMWIEFPVMVSVGVICLPIFFTGRRVNRGEGSLLLAYFIAWTVFLVLNAQEHPAAGRLGTGLLGVALPLTLIGIFASVVLAVRIGLARHARLKSVRIERAQRVDPVDTA